MSQNFSHQTAKSHTYGKADKSQLFWMISTTLASLPYITDKLPYVVREVSRIALILLVFRWKFIVVWIGTLISAQTVATTLILAALAWRYNRVEPPIINQSEPFLQALLFPCRTTHTRVFPTKHSFSYSYLLVGIPIGWNGQAGLLSITERTWLSVNTEDYLQRGSHPDGLSGKLTEYLKSQGIDPNSFPFAYLVTAPRFLGFSFNPVSFWYLYDKHKILKAMILEVNNTFDERRMYFLQGEENPTSFKQKWQKDFHVSPFNDREGSYSLSAEDLLSTLRVDNNIVLTAQDGTPKLVARIFSTGKAINPVMSAWQTFKFMLSWAWVGFLTNPRILREARILWTKRLQVFYRPEPLKSSIGRNESPEEIEIEQHFRCWLERVSESEDLQILYKPAAGKNRGKEVLLGRSNCSSTLTVNVLTAAFYSELVTMHSMPAILERLSSNNASLDKMVWTENPRKLAQLAMSSQAEEGSTTWIEAFLFKLRGTPVSTTTDAPRTFKRGRSDFDELAKRDGTTKRYYDYLYSACLVCISNRIALGSTWLLKIYWKILHWLLLYAGASLILTFVE